ncbi:MAG TPA: non-homologous end-joining DNA ligase [Gemmatimonadales bacterium]|nr:non-homologous end-joining DNA ligase [Gemmatimonadales bacterium]
MPGAAKRRPKVGTRSLVEQLDAAGDRATLVIDGHELAVTSLEKQLWPGQGRRRGATKRDLLRYLARVAPYMLPHLADRPLFVTRFPDGVTGKSFFQKHWEPAPPFARTVDIHSAQNERDGSYLLCDNVATLLWLGQMAGLELHAWFSRVNPEPDGRAHGRRFTGSEATLERSILNYPDFIVFDLDPYVYSGREGRGEEPELHRRAFARVRRLALRIREILEGLGLVTFIKTSGRTGLHLYLPILRELDFDAARGVAETIARHVQQERPKDVTVEWAVRRRTGKIFFDFNQNSRGKSLATPFSPRRHPAATVSMPITWDELERIYPTDFTLHTVPDRLESQGDSWAGMLEAKQDLAAVVGASGAGSAA